MSHISITSLRVYPVKSTRPVFPASTLVEKRGLQHDRRWMIVDEHGVFRTRREVPVLARIQSRIESDHLAMSKDGMPEVCLPLVPQGPPIDVDIWGTVTTGDLVSPEADEWLTAAIGMPSRLVYMSESARREINPAYNAGDDVVGFADAYPILVISEDSVADLNSRLDSPVPVQRFRPNVVIKGCDPYEEDTWKRLRMGDIVLRAVRPDIRCLVTTQDPDTGEVLGKEPLRTLATYRKVEGGVIFGMYYVPETLGPVSVGDTCVPA